MSTPSQVKYSRLPTGETTEWHQKKESVAIDFSSPFSYESAFTYSKVIPPYVEEKRTYDPSLVTRLCSSVVVILCFLFVFITFPVSGWLSIKVVEQFERVVVFRLGRLQQPKGPGIIVVLPFVDKWRRVDMRTRAFNVPPQQFLTKDGAAVSIGATVFHRITDVALSVASIQDLNHSTRVLGQTILLNLLSSQGLDTIENYKPSLNDRIQKEMNTATISWGVEISRVELSEVTVIQEAALMSAQKVGGILGQLAGQLGGGGMPGGNWMQPLLQASSPGMQPRLLPPKNSPSASPEKSQLVTSTTPDKLMISIQSVLNADLVQSVGAVYVFHITGGNGGTYFLDLKSGCGAVGKGVSPSCEPDVVLTTSISDMQAMFSGQLRPFVAYMTGQLQVEGDRATAMRLEQVIQKVQEIQCRQSVVLNV